MASTGPTEDVHPNPTTGPPLSDPVPPPRLGDAVSTARFGTFWKHFSEGALSEQRMREVIWFEIDLHCVADRSGHGLWLRCEPDPRGGAWSVCRAFSSSALAGRRLEESPGLTQRIHASGLEILRWLHAAPTPPERLLVDWYEGSPAWIELPVTLAASAVFPHFQHIEDLTAVERIALSRLGALPRTGGLRPQIARALLTGWRDLVGFTSAPTPVSYAGGHWLPVFSDQRQAFAFAREHRDFQPARAGAAPAFLEWLAAARDVDGLLLDSESAAPLPIDHTALLLLDGWGLAASEQPDGGALVAAVARQLAAGAIGPSLAARIVADWPRYHLVAPLHRISAGSVPEPERALVFSRIDDAEQLVALAAAGRTTIVPADAEVLTILHGWGRSVFHVIARAFAGALIDPTLTEDGQVADGLALDDTLVRTAAERVDTQLAPRIP
jgi:hypothetical protein